MSTTDRNERRRFQLPNGVLLFAMLAIGLCIAFVATREKGPAARAALTSLASDERQARDDEVSLPDDQPDAPAQDATDAAFENDRTTPDSEIGDADSTEPPTPTTLPERARIALAAEHGDKVKPLTTAAVDRTSSIASKGPTVKTAVAVRPRVRDDSGVVFIGQSDQIALVKAQMRALLGQMGWTTDQVQVREPGTGERIAYMLNSAPGDTNTFVLSQRPQLGIASEVIRYTNRHGETKTLALVSQKEILATMLQAGRAFVFSGPNCLVERLKEQIALRQNIVYWGMRTDWVFPEDKTYRYNTADYWQVMKGDDWTLKPGIRISDAVADAFVGKFSYQIGCTSACRFIYVHGILNFYQQVRPNAAVLARLEQLLDNRRPYIDIAPKIDRQTRTVVKEGRLMERHSDVPWDNWVPGDWGWVKNPDDKSAEELGSEGCNIIYAGGGYFVNYYPERPPKTLDQGLKRVYGWRFGLEESELDLPADLMQQLRQDPRAGGMLRDVRDFPKSFGAGMTVTQPGA